MKETQRMRVLIIEDEIYSFNDLRDMILKLYPTARVDGPVTNLADMEEAMRGQSDYDIIYSDIRLEDGDCFTIFERTETTVPVIFTTAYSDFALKAFEVNGIAYILKPVIPEALWKATEKALSLRRGSQDLSGLLSTLGRTRESYLQFLKARTYDGACIIRLGDVSYFVVEGSGVYVLLNNHEKYKVDYTLDGLIARLDPMMFFKANRQYIISRNAVTRIRAWDNRRIVIRLAGYDDVQIIISKNTASALDRWIEQ